jgi:hypothetical protein
LPGTARRSRTAPRWSASSNRKVSTMTPSVQPV